MIMRKERKTARLRRRKFLTSLKKIILLLLVSISFSAHAIEYVISPKLNSIIVQLQKQYRGERIQKIIESKDHYLIIMEYRSNRKVSHIFLYNK